VIKKEKYATPRRRALSLFLVISMAMAASTLVAQEKKPHSLPASNGAGQRLLLRPVVETLPSVGGAWIAQGPGPITNGATMNITNRPVAGALNAVVAHPTNADILWVASVNGGIWKTTNATSSSPTWIPQTDTFSSLSVANLERDPTDSTSNTLVAAAGAVSSFRLSGPLGSLLRTTDGGTTWSALNPTALAGKNITGIAPRGSTIVVAANFCGAPIFRSIDSGASFSALTGFGLSRVWDLAGDPTANAVLYAAVSDCLGGTTVSGMYKSSDTGANWSKVSNSTIDTLLASAFNAEISVGNSGQVYVSIVTQNGVVNGQPNYQLAGIFRSGSGGSSWTQLDTPTTTEGTIVYGIHPGGQGDFHLSLAADPSNVNLVYVGGDRQPDFFPSSIGANDFSGRLFRVNAAATPGSQSTPLTNCPTTTVACTSVSTTSNSAPHADSRAMVFDANGNLLETDDGGIYRRTSPSGTGDWFSVIGSLQITEVHDVVYDRISNMIMGGNQDTGSAEQTTAGGTTWATVNEGDGGDAACDDMSSEAQSIRYSAAQNLFSFQRRTMDGNGTATSFLFPGMTLLSGTNIQPQFVTPTKLNQIDPRRVLFVGGNDLYESLDRGDTISGLGIGATNKSFNTAVYGGRSSGVDNLDLIYAIGGQVVGSSFSPVVYVRTSGGGAPVPTAATPGTAALKSIAVDPTDWTKAYVVNSSGQVFSTSNTGGTWTNITGNLASGTTDLQTIAFIPGNPSVIAVGGLYGVFRMATNNAGVWHQLGTGLPNTYVYDLDYDPLDDVLVAGTLGRGAWKLSGVAVSGTPPSLSIGDATITEGNSGATNATFTVSLSAAVPYTVGVDYRTADGTATGLSTTAANVSFISIPTAGTASPYPSTITVAGVTNPINKVTVTLRNFNHTFPSDVDVLLIAPNGQKAVLMASAGGSSHSNKLDLTFDDAAATQLPSSNPLMSGTYRLSNYRTPNSFPSPAPGGPYASSLSTFNGASANGTWSLYVVDQFGPDSGSFSGGWSLTFTSGDYSPSSGTLVFPPSTTSKTITVPVFGDTTPEGDEFFIVFLTNPANATFADSLGQGTIINDDVPSNPTSVVATATTTTNVNVNWAAAAGATSYHVYRSSGGGIYSQVGTPSASPFNDSTAAPNTAYLYKVRAVAGSVESTDSNVDLATTVIFTDPTITGGTTLVKTAHLTELLTAVNAVRALAGFGATTFTTPAPGLSVIVLGAHINDLRNGLNPARSTLGLTAQLYTDPTIAAGTTLIKATHITDLRNGVQ
jgi:subtilisin-like proprotein convertase family protein